MCRLPGKECLATGAQTPRKLQIMGFPRAFASLVQGTEVEKAFPTLEFTVTTSAFSLNTCVVTKN